jgi:adenylylsulfate kinase
MGGRNLIGSSSLITESEKISYCGHRPCVLWFTGLSGSGKSTISRNLEKRLWDMGHYNSVLDGDNVRIGLNRDLGFSPEDRTENNRRVAEMAEIVASSGAIVTTALISPFQDSRDDARKSVSCDFFEVHIDCSIESCIYRDPKGLYKKVQSGDIKDFTGFTSSYESPKNPDLTLNTDDLSVDQCVDRVIHFLSSKGIFI